MRVEMPDQQATGEAPAFDSSWSAIIPQWRAVVADLMVRGIDLYDPAVLARPWPGVRTLIFSLLEPESDSFLRRALIRG